MYFISYQWKKLCDWNPAHILTETHPLEWLYEMNEEPESYHLLWWKRLTEDEETFIRPYDDLPLT